MTKSPVWITGIGVCTPLGHTVDDLADALIAGRSGVRTVTAFDASQHPSQIAASVGAVPCPASWDATAFSQLDRTQQVVAFTIESALRSAGYWENRRKSRIGLVLGLGTEWLLAWEADGAGLMRPEVKSAAEWASRHYELAGPVVTLSAACASGNYAFSIARNWLRRGLVDACLAGGCDLAVTPMTLAGFGNLRALSRRNDAPQAASRPFDRGRDGFVLGEGGAVCLMERAADARRRGASAFAEVAGCGATSDAHHLVIPGPDGTAAAEAVRKALADAGVSPDEVDYINAHGTGTPVGDIAEAKALRKVFGSAADRVPISSTKGATGHLLTAAAAVEAVAGMIAMDRGVIPATLNLDDPDPECPLAHVAKTAIERPVRVIVSNSFGFGGSNTSLVLKAA